MNKPKTTTGTIRLAPETWVKLRELFQYYGGAGVVKTAWFTRWINKKHPSNQAKTNATGNTATRSR
jgi:hypothetical protein